MFLMNISTLGGFGGIAASFLSLDRCQTPLSQNQDGSHLRPEHLSSYSPLQSGTARRARDSWELGWYHVTVIGYLPLPLLRLTAEREDACIDWQDSRRPLELGPLCRTESVDVNGRSRFAENTNQCVIFPPKT